MTSAPAPLDRPARSTERRRPTAATVFACAAIVALLFAFVQILTSDPGDLRVAGDEASFVLNGLSLQGGDLSYDAEDHARWLELGWADQPLGLFLQRNDGGWAVAKPVGYSVLLSPALAAFGLRGVPLVGAFLLLLYALGWFLAGRVRWGVATSIVVAVVASIFSYAWFYSFPAHADLFVAVVVGFVAVGSLYARVYADPRAFWVAMVAAGVLVGEKVPALLALVPLLVIGGRCFGTRRIVVGLALFAVTGALAAAPYLYYSDFQSWSAYGGERYYALATTPFSGGTEDDLIRVESGEKLSPSYIYENVTDPSSDIPAAAMTYVVGRHTGVMTFMPIVPLLVGASSVAAWRAWRRGRHRSSEPAVVVEPVDEREHDADSELGSGQQAARGADAVTSPSRWPTLAQDAGPVFDLFLAALASLVLYMGFYIVLFTNNYYGGGQSIGSRYFLQFSLAAAVVPAATGLSRKVVHAAAAFAVVWSLLVLTPHMRHPDRAFVEMWKTSRVQELLPDDTTQRGQW